MATGQSRRNFLRGRFREADVTVMRPPGAVAVFAKLCDGCGHCAEACPEGIVSSGPEGPSVDVSRGACTFCGACAQACPTGALAEEAMASWPWRAAIADSCLSVNGVTCRACEDACDLRAIRFRLLTGGRSEPVLDTDQCSGCGGCVTACPVGAASMVHASREDTGAMT